MLRLARVVAELLVSRLDSLPGERAWEGDFKDTLEDQLMEPPPEDGRPAARC